MSDTIKLTSRRIGLALMGIISFLLVANLTVIYLRYVKGHEHIKGFLQGFYFDVEANIPSCYSTLTILFAAGLLWLIGKLPREKQEGRSYYWKSLSFIFVFLAVDEFASIHEGIIPSSQQMIGITSGKASYLYFAWFIPYVGLFAIAGLLLLRFFLRLSVRMRVLLATAGTVFLSGAVGMEMVGGKYWAEQGWAVDGSDQVDLQYALIVTIEELLEMVGIVILIYTLATYYLKEKNRIDIAIMISDSEGSASPEAVRSLPADRVPVQAESPC